MLFARRPSVHARRCSRRFEKTLRGARRCRRSRRAARHNSAARGALLNTLPVGLEACARRTGCSGKRPGTPSAARIPPPARPAVPTRSPLTQESVSRHAEFYRPDACAERIGRALVAEAGRLASAAGMQATDFALTLLLHPDDPRDDVAQPAGFSYRGDVMFYPCSVVKLFLVVAAQRALGAGRLTPHEELDRACAT